jgi:hypothetical protein
MSNDGNQTMLPEIFDPATEQGNDLLPVATYVAQIIEAAVSQPNSGNGHQIALTWQITEGEWEGRYVWQRITFMHSSAQATAIGRRQFKDLCVATGISEQVADVTVFKFIPCKIKVGIEVDKQGAYDDKNKVLRILPLDQPDAGPTPVKTVKPPPGPKPATAAAAAKPAAATGVNGSNPPWRKSAAKPTPIANTIDDEIPY